MLEQLRQKLETLLNQMKVLSDSVLDDKGSVRSFNAEENTRYQNFEAEVATVRSAIKRLETEEEHRQEVARLNAPAGKAPNVQITREADHNEEGEYRGFKYFGEFLRAVAMESTPGKEDQRDPRLQAMQRSITKRAAQTRAASGHSENIGADGGFLVQTDFQQELQTKSFAASMIAPLCEQVTISSGSNELVWNEVVEDSRVAGSRNGGVRVYRDKEAGTVAASQVKLRRQKLIAEKMTAIAYATEELLGDVAGLQSLIEPQFVKEMGFILDEEIINGDGDGECEGILNCPALIVVAKESGQAASTVLYANVRKMHGQIFSESEANAIWLTGTGVVQELETMAFDPAATSKTPVYLPANGVSDRRFGTMYGAPVRRNEHLPALTSQGDLMYCDFSQYRLVKKGGIQGAVSQHVRFIYGENTFRWTQRVNGRSTWRLPLTPAKGSLTSSPFIALGAR